MNNFKKFKKFNGHPPVAETPEERWKETLAIEVSELLEVVCIHHSYQALTRPIAVAVALKFIEVCEGRGPVGDGRRRNAKAGAA